MLEIKKELINGETSLLGVIGNPVSHSLSPVIHNAAFKELNLNWCYLAIPCEEKNLELTVRALRTFNCKGLNITIPHKHNAIKLCNEVHPIAKAIGAVNTLIPNNDNSWDGTNTDVEGFLTPIKNEDIGKIEKAIIIGTGGSARAILYGLLSINISEIIVISRTTNSLNRFLSSIIINSNNITKINGLTKDDKSIIENIQQADLIINATPIGMKNKSLRQNSIEMPINQEIWQNLNSNTILYDLIYTPRPTEWLKTGAKYGCKQIDGLEMLIQQGAASLKMWSGINEMPIEIMREAAKKAIL